MNLKSNISLLCLSFFIVFLSGDIFADPCKNYLETKDQSFTIKIEKGGLLWGRDSKHLVLSSYGRTLGFIDFELENNVMTIQNSESYVKNKKVYSRLLLYLSEHYHFNEISGFLVGTNLDVFYKNYFLNQDILSAAIQTPFAKAAKRIGFTTFTKETLRDLHLKSQQIPKIMEKYGLNRKESLEYVIQRKHENGYEDDILYSLTLELKKP